jgi:c(7)-type cytochrome triheme protein
MVSNAQIAPPADFTYPKGKGSPAPVTFSHARHAKVARGRCDRCHPQVFAMSRSSDLHMHDMHVGKECGTCHNGRQAFTVARDCMLCHVPPGLTGAALTPVSSTQRRPPTDHRYPRGKGSPGPVTFSHSRHLASGAACSGCHPDPFAMAKPTANTPGVSMVQMFQGKECAKCHNGTKAFTVSKDCALCHRPAEANTASR